MSESVVEKTVETIAIAIDYKIEPSNGTPPKSRKAPTCATCGSPRKGHTRVSCGTPVKPKPLKEAQTNVVSPTNTPKTDIAEALKDLEGLTITPIKLTRRVTRSTTTLRRPLMGNLVSGQSSPLPTDATTPLKSKKPRNSEPLLATPAPLDSLSDDETTILDAVASPDGAEAKKEVMPGGLGSNASEISAQVLSHLPSKVAHEDAKVVNEDPATFLDGSDILSESPALFRVSEEHYEAFMKVITKKGYQYHEARARAPEVWHWIAVGRTREDVHQIKATAGFKAVGGPSDLSRLKYIAIGYSAGVMTIFLALAGIQV
ncbi:hypothetical protein SISSUDRAFT_1040823 [Sistotremastrum suecicum HHB10207 ss-3]|uniref:Uncharacterized protein n=1 Tax=Sistotremastrum suecicum HHB10207 ss-3 TaxID=1314776 RepID=A0A166HPR8_9AGAM|nr:hypothetical protein SISSUDRAFT_1040823 [Sistotremastrum suecicum HHB10207 ss-3]